MLVLSRKEGEKLVIGDNVTLVVSKISGNRVTVGIEAPADVKIFRGELAAKDKEKSQQPRVVPLRRAATVTIDLDDLLPGEAEAELAELEKHAV
ncbi:MAG: carbon storage regulator [Planctomycetota bacterium]